MGTNVKSVLSLHNCSLSLVLYSTFYFTWKNSNGQMWTFIHWEDIRFWSSFLSLSATSHQGHGLITPAELKLVPSAPCKLFREQPGTSSWTSLTVVSHILGFETPWTYCSWHTEECTDRFFLEELWPHEIQIMSSEHCSSDKYPFYFPFLH